MQRQVAIVATETFLKAELLQHSHFKSVLFVKNTISSDESSVARLGGFHSDFAGNNCFGQT